MRQSTQGFTFVEIILVILMMGVIAAMAIPNFSRTYLRFQLQQCTEDLAYLMRYAQSRAVAKGQMVRLEFDSEFRHYRLTQNNADDSFADAEQNFINIAGRLGRKVNIPQEIRVETSDPLVYFYTDGNMEKQRIYICLKEHCQTVSTQEQRGFVQVFDSRVE